MNSNLVFFAVFCTFALSPASALWMKDVTGKNASYIFEGRVHSNLKEEQVKVSLEVQVKGPNFSIPVNLIGSPFGWYNGYNFYYLVRVPKETNLYETTEYTIEYTSFEADANADRVVSVSDIAIVEPDVKEPKNVRLCSQGLKNQDKTDLVPGKSVTLTKCA